MNDPLVAQMKNYLAQKGYSAAPKDVSGQDWFAKTAPAPVETPKDTSFSGALLGTATPDAITSAQGGDSQMIQHPIEALKGGIKNIADLGVTLDKGAEAVGKTVLPDIGTSKTENSGLDFKPVDEMTQPSNEAQKEGGFVSNFIPAERAISTAKPLIEGGINLAKDTVKPIGEALAKRQANKADSAIKDLITPDLNKKATETAIKTGKVKEGGVFKERDITKAVPNFEKMTKTLKEVPNIGKGTTLEKTNAIHDHIGTVANDLRTQIKTAQTQTGKDRGFFTPNEFKGYMDGVKSSLSENPTLVGDAEKTADKILSKFSSLVKQEGHTPEGLLNARQKLDSWMSSQKGSNVFDPKTENAVSAALRGVRQGANDFLAKKVPDVAVKAMLKKQSLLYDALDITSAKASKEGGSKLGRLVTKYPKTAGAVGTLGAIAGEKALKGLGVPYLP